VIGNLDSVTLVNQAMAGGGFTYDVIADLSERTAEGLRVIGMCLLITGLAAFPSGRRRGMVPMELAVLIITFIDRSLSTYAPEWMGPYRSTVGADLMIGAGLLLLAWRFWGNKLVALVPRPRRAAA
jgi:lipopolysaccharide export system permease protein